MVGGHALGLRESQWNHEGSQPPLHCPVFTVPGPTWPTLSGQRPLLGGSRPGEEPGEKQQWPVPGNPSKLMSLFRGSVHLRPGGSTDTQVIDSGGGTPGRKKRGGQCPVASSPRSQHSFPSPQALSSTQASPRLLHTFPFPSGSENIPSVPSASEARLQAACWPSQGGLSPSVPSLLPQELRGRHICRCT